MMWVTIEALKFERRYPPEGIELIALRTTEYPPIQTVLFLLHLYEVAPEDSKRHRLRVALGAALSTAVEDHGEWHVALSTNCKSSVLDI